jgi:hypothetical protein
MKTVTALILSVLSLGVAPAKAVLGQSVESVRSDQQRLEGQLRAVVLDGYSVQQITRGDGAVVKEFVSPGGAVFGVSWQGPTMPNLAQLLGAYFPQFQQGARSSVHRRGPLVVRSGDLVVESGGHMRAFRGRAYLTNLVPKNLSPAVVR